jgi:hypothetical protein
LRTVGHGGADAGYRSDVVRFPDQGGGGGLAVAVLCNLAPINPSQLTRQVAEVFLGDRMAAPPARPAAVEVAESELAKWAGVYRNPVTDDVRRFSVREGKLALGQSGGPSLTALAPDRFQLPDQGPEFRFAAPSPSTVQATLIAEGQRPVTFRREPPFKPDAAALSGYAGRYRSDELDVVYDVAPADSGLTVKHPKLGTVRLQPLFPDAFQGSGETIGFLARFTRDAKGRVDGFLVTAGRVRRVRFEKQGPGTRDRGPGVVGRGT